MEMFYSSGGSTRGCCNRRQVRNEEDSPFAIFPLSRRHEPVGIEVRTMTDRFGPLTFVMATAFISTLLWLSAMVGHFAR